MGRTEMVDSDELDDMEAEVRGLRAEVEKHKTALPRLIAAMFGLDLSESPRKVEIAFAECSACGRTVPSLCAIAGGGDTWLCRTCHCRKERDELRAEVESLRILATGSGTLAVANERDRLRAERDAWRAEAEAADSAIDDLVNLLTDLEIERDVDVMASLGKHEANKARRREVCE